MSFGDTLSPLNPPKPAVEQPQPKPAPHPGDWLDAWWFDLILVICLVFVMVQVLLPFLLSSLH